MKTKKTKESPFDGDGSPKNQAKLGKWMEEKTFQQAEWLLLCFANFPCDPLKASLWFPCWSSSLHRNLGQIYSNYPLLL
jgi:hypothetical protein